MLSDLKIGDKGHATLHKNIRARLLDTREFSTIQAAIDAGGTVRFSPGVYPVSQTIQCKSGADLWFEHGAVLQAAENVDILKLAPDVDIHGLTIDCSQISFNKSALLIDGDSRFSFGSCVLSNVRLKGTGAGTGIRMQAKQQAAFYPYIFGVTVQNFSIANFAQGLWMEATESASEQMASINANQFANGYFQDCQSAIKMNFIEAKENSLLGIGGNNFANIQVQPNGNSANALYCEGSHNLFNNFFVWDWQIATQAQAIELTARSKRNVINTNLPNTYLLDAGANRFITPDA